MSILYIPVIMSLFDTIGDFGIPFFYKIVDHNELPFLLPCSSSYQNLINKHQFYV